MRSDAVRKGMQQAPHRSLFNALGMTEEEMNKPLVGIVSSYNEISASPLMSPGFLPVSAPVPLCPSSF